MRDFDGTGVGSGRDGSYFKESATLGKTSEKESCHIAGSCSGQSDEGTIWSCSYNESMELSFPSAAGPLIGAIAAGNCVALKLSEYAPNSIEYHCSNCK